MSQLKELDLLGTKKVKFKSTLPSTNKQFSFRPFNVDDEKVLLMAHQQVSPDQPEVVLDALKEMVVRCTDFDVHDVNKMSNFDLTYVWIQLRKHSVGELAKVHLTCEHCNHQTKLIDVNFDNAKLVKPEGHSLMVKLNENLAFEFEYATLDHTKIIAAKGEFEGGMEIVARCLKNVYHGDEVIDCSTEPYEEKRALIGQLNNDQFQQVANSAFATQPNMQMDITFNCSNTECSTEGAEQARTLSGLIDFLA